MANSDIYFYTRETHLSFIRKRHKAEKILVSTVLQMERKLLDIILEYSRISDKLVHTSSYRWAESALTRLGGIAVKCIAHIVPGEFDSITQHEICCILIDNLNNLPRMLFIAFGLREIIESLVTMDASNIKYTIRDENATLEERLILLEHKHEMAQDLLQFIAWF